MDKVATEKANGEAMVQHKLPAKHTTEDSIEALTQCTIGNATERRQREFRDALRALVAMAKAEKASELDLAALGQSRPGD